MDQPARLLGESGWSLRLIQYLPNFADATDKQPSDPAISFELSRPDGIRAGLALTARRGGQMFPLQGYPPVGSALQDLWAWYHPPTQRHGDLLALLQFAADADGSLHDRSFSSIAAAFTFEKAGVIGKGGDWQPVWTRMHFKLRVNESLRTAGPGPHFVPLVHGPVNEDQAAPAIRCRLSQRSAAAEFWLGKTDGGLTPVSAGAAHVQVGYNSTLRSLGFELTLVKSEQTTDPGSRHARQPDEHVAAARS